MKYPVVFSYIATMAFLAMTVLWKEEQAKDTGYVPKSQRWKRTNRMKAYLQERGRVATEFMENKLNKWLETPKDKYKRKIHRDMCNNIRNEVARVRRPPQKVLTLLSTIVILNNTSGALANAERGVIFDTDSTVCGVDNRASYSISHVAGDFEGELEECVRVINDFRGRRKVNIKKGTLIWRWEDDMGKPHKFRIPNSYYIPDGRQRLLSPQHWAQAINKADPKSKPNSKTDDKIVTLEWGNGKFRRTIPLGKVDNVATFNLASGYDKYTEFYRKLKYNQTIMDDTPITIDEVNIVENDEETKKRGSS